jgi:hypothetical protein
MPNKILSGRKLPSSEKMTDMISSDGKWLSSERCLNTLAKWLSTTERMTEFTVTTRKWLSSLKWLSNITKMDEHYRKND